MNTAVPPAWHAFFEGEERAYECTCCGKLNHWGNGELHSQSDVLADYWYEWPDGHEGQFSLAVCLRDDSGQPARGAGVVVLRGSVTATDLRFTAVDVEASPWKDFGPFGAVIPRDAFLSSPFRTRIFDIVDAVVARDDRLVGRLERLIERSAS